MLQSGSLDPIQLPQYHPYVNGMERVFFYVIPISHKCTFAAGVSDQQKWNHYQRDAIPVDTPDAYLKYMSITGIPNGDEHFFITCVDVPAPDGRAFVNMPSHITGDGDMGYP